jgi:hypothetical protein
MDENQMRHGMGNPQFNPQSQQFNGAAFKEHLRRIVEQPINTQHPSALLINEAVYAWLSTRLNDFMQYGMQIMDL